MPIPTVGTRLPQVVAAHNRPITPADLAALGSLCIQQAVLAHTDTAAKVLFTLPAEAKIVNFKFHVKTAFNAGTSNVVDLGDGTTANRFVNDAAVGSAGLVLLATADDAVLSAETDIRGVYVPGGTAPTAGHVVITVEYVR